MPARRSPTTCTGARAQQPFGLAAAQALGAAAVPEPAMAWMLVAGRVLIALRVRRLRPAQAAITRGSLPA